MTEYWKSQARKYCEFCKCWFADNKVSVSFHENGKKHKENVQNHISQLSKRSAKEFKTKEKLDDDMKKMEAAAMAAYLKDVQNNADITSQNINNMLIESGSSISTEPTVATTSKSAPVWREVKSEDGHSYYWNKQTNETTWDAPDEYVSLAEQEEKKKESKSKRKKGEKKDKEVFKEVEACLAREQMRELAVKSEPRPLVNIDTSIGPAPRATDPYGSWKAVEKEPEHKVDLQLPKLPARPAPPVVMEPERVQFKEKRVQSLGDEPVEFKKRKVNISRRNMRQKLDDE